MISVLAALVVGALSGCATEVAGLAQQAPGAARKATPERIQIRLVLEDVTDTGLPSTSDRSDAGGASPGTSIPGTVVRPSSAPDGSVVMADETGRRFLLGPAELDGAQIETVTARPNPTEAGSWEVDIAMTATGKAAFTELTRVNTGQRFAIVVSRVVISTPRITTVIDEGKVRITGGFDEHQAKVLAKSIDGR